jgi:hypothetical protein
MNENRPESPQLKELDNPEMLEDNPYFYEDKPPSPKFKPLPPGREIATQIEDNELFDFDLEVEPILQVLVGRSMVQATYELIEEEERYVYLEHKKKYEQEREFELMKLQRLEAARKRREDEKRRREKQVKHKNLYDVEIQKKLISKVSAKFYLKNLKKNTLSQLLERGILVDNKEIKLSLHVNYDYIPNADSLCSRNDEIQQLNNKIKFEKEKILLLKHHVVVTEKKEYLNKIKEDKENQIKVKIF